MKRNISHGGSRAGFTLLELILILFAFVGFIILLALGFSRVREASRLHTCIGNLQTLLLANVTWANENESDISQLPFLVSTNRGGTLEFLRLTNTSMHLKVPTNYLETPRVLHCPADRGRSPASSNLTDVTASNTSYFIALDQGIPPPAQRETWASAVDLVMLGDRNLSTNRNDGHALESGLNILCKTNALSWTKEIHHEKGNLGMWDGSFQTVRQSSELTDLVFNYLETNRVIIP